MLRMKERREEKEREKGTRRHGNEHHLVGVVTLLLPLLVLGRGLDDEDSIRGMRSSSNSNSTSEEEDEQEEKRDRKEQVDVRLLICPSSNLQSSTCHDCGWVGVYDFTLIINRDDMAPPVAEATTESGRMG